jgi:hypothetical protein
VLTNAEIIMQDNLENKMQTYNEKCFQHAQNWKKIRALVNYSKTIEEFKEWEALEFIVRYFERDYLDQAQESFLDYILMKHDIEYDKWCYRTYWVKKQMKKCEGQLKFFFPDLEKEKIEARSKMPLFSKLERFKIYNTKAI